MRSKIFKPVNTLVLKKDHIPPANSEIIHPFFMPAFFVELVTSLTKLAYRLLTETATRTKVESDRLGRRKYLGAVSGGSTDCHCTV